MTTYLTFVASYATGEQGMEEYTGDHLSPTHDEIARLAFSLYESRGRQDGQHIEDWLRAEQELLRQLRIAAKDRPVHTTH